MFLAINELRKEKSRFILVTLVIVLVSYLAFFLTALAYGLASSYTRAMDQWDASGIVLADNANNNVGRSLLFESDYRNLLGSTVAPLGVGLGSVSVDDSRDVALFGIDTSSYLAPAILSGRAIASDNEILVSSELESIGVRLDESVRLQGGDTAYKVVGFVQGASFQAAPVIYMSLDAWRTAVSDTSGMTSMRDNTAISALVTRGAPKAAYSSGGLSWQTIQDFAFELPGYRPQVLTFSMMIGFLIAISSFVLAIFIYILTLQKASIFGVLKAEGVPSSYIGRSVIVQVLLISVTGLAVGMVLALLTGWSLAGKVPFVVNGLFFAGITLLFLVCAGVGGLASVRSVVKIDPARAIS